jgi:malate dehydrogenase (quinone)
MSSHIENPDVVLIGSGVMSANLGALLKRLDPQLRIQVYEAADELAYESSNGWNNAGTGHAGICEISYTPITKDGSPVKVQKVIDIFQEFEQSLQFWGHAVASGMIDNPKEFINPLPHVAFVDGEEQVRFLRSRYDGMKAHHFFAAMEWSTDHAKIGSWAPLLTEGRDPAPADRRDQDGRRHRHQLRQRFPQAPRVAGEATRLLRPREHQGRGPEKGRAGCL